MTGPECFVIAISLFWLHYFYSNNQTLSSHYLIVYDLGYASVRSHISIHYDANLLKSRWYNFHIYFKSGRKNVE